MRNVMVLVLGLLLASNFVLAQENVEMNVIDQEVGMFYVTGSYFEQDADMRMIGMDIRLGEMAGPFSMVSLWTVGNANPTMLTFGQVKDGLEVPCFLLIDYDGVLRINQDKPEDEKSELDELDDTIFVPDLLLCPLEVVTDAPTSADIDFFLNIFDLAYWQQRAED
jgi:hypothetical protein